MSEFESHNFEHLIEEIAHNKNPREELDKMYPDDKDKLRVVKSAIEKMNLELEDLGQRDSTRYGDAEITALERLPDDIAVFENMKKELEASIGEKEEEPDNIQDLGKID